MAYPTTHVVLLTVRQLQIIDRLLEDAEGDAMANRNNDHVMYASYEELSEIRKSTKY
jgi:hypothetical protein